MDEFASIIGQSVQQNNEWSARQAQAQMDFQERMSNTAFQRQMADLKAAGLNPVLAAKLGGASTPNGAMGDTDTSGTSALVDLLMMSMETANSAAGAARAAAESSDNTLGLPLIKNPRQMWQLAWNYFVDHQDEIIDSAKTIFNSPKQFQEEYKELWEEDQLRRSTAPAHSRYGKAAKADQKKAEKAKSFWKKFLLGPTV